MVNKPKIKGTAAESAVLKHVRANGFVWAERLALSGAADCGDISLVPGRAAIIEVKSYAGPPALGQPATALLTEWMRQAEAERVNAGAEIALLVAKRKGSTDPATWWAWLPMWSVGALMGLPSGAAGDFARAAGSVHVAPVCMSLASATTLLRAAGFGTPLEEEPSDTPGSLCSGSGSDADAGQVSADGRGSQRLSEAPTSEDAL